ncbi:ATP-binding protein [Streptomyces sp. NPDC006706]|uniref:ATP-binding protein n=1 Tax=Streptomyces sp. NPDC006706 TaxID=3364761 RepID=UPI00367EB3CB
MTTTPDRQRPPLPPAAEQPVLTLRFTASPRGARLARRLASHQMDAWGWGYGAPVHDAVELVVAELAANAATHGLVPGRDAELRLSREGDGCVRVEVSDARGERLPAVRDAGTGEDGGRGLLLVASLAKEWGTIARPGAPGKTVWAVVAPGAPAAPAPRTSPGEDEHARRAAADELTALSQEMGLIRPVVTKAPDSGRAGAPGRQ